MREQIIYGGGKRVKTMNHNALPSLIGLGLAAAAVMWSQPRSVRDGIVVSASTFAFTIAMHFAVKFVIDRFAASGGA